jgi:hypothetical protein
MPHEVSWWPLAPGWFVLIGIVLLASLFLIQRLWKRWQGNAYRRAALRELDAADNATAVAEILRRTALAFAPRDEIAAKTGTSWIEWLASRSPEEMPTIVRDQLSNSIYAAPCKEPLINDLRDYARAWILHHKTIVS